MKEYTPQNLYVEIVYGNRKTRDLTWPQQKKKSKTYWKRVQS